MDTTRFDRLARGLAMAGSRRTALRLLIGGLAAGLLAPRAATPGHAQGGSSDLYPCLDAGDAGFVLCGNRCALLGVDGQNCGACGVVCQVDQLCRDGVCIPHPDFLPPLGPAEPGLPPADFVE